MSILRRFAAFIALTTALGVCGVPAAKAQSEREALQAARLAMEEGQEHYAGGRFDQAAEAFDRAYQARPFSAFLYNAAVAWERHGEFTQAADYYQRYLDAEPAASEAAELTEKIRALRAAVAAAQAPPDGTNPDGTNPDGTNPDGTNPDGTNPDGTNPDGTNPDGTNPETTPTTPITPPTPPPTDIKSLLSIQTDPIGAVVSIFQGETRVATGPTLEAGFDQTLDEGDYRIMIEHPDYRTVEETVHLGQGRVYVVIVEMSQGQFLGYLRVVTDPPDADVYVDNLEDGAVGRSPYANVVGTGEHTVWVERPGYQRVERTIEIGLGEDIEVRVELERVPFGRIRVTGNLSGAAVSVDGELVGAVPYEGDVMAGEHRITVSADDMKDWSETVNIIQGQVIPIQVRLRPSVSRGGAWASASIGVLAIGGGVALAILSNNLETDLRRERDQGTLASDDPRLLRGRIYSAAANGAFGLGALLGFLSLYYFLRDPLPDSEAQIFESRDWSMIPQLDLRTRSGGAQFQVRF